MLIHEFFDYTTQRHYYIGLYNNFFNFFTEFLCIYGKLQQIG